MFLYLLNKQQGQVFQKMAAKLIQADGISESSEKDAYDAMSREMGLPPLLPESLEIVPDDYKAFDSRPVRVAALLELIGLGYSDSDYSAEESECLAKISQAFGISRVEVMVLENWALRQYALLREVKDILGGDKKEE